MNTTARYLTGQALEIYEKDFFNNNKNKKNLLDGEGSLKIRELKFDNQTKQ